MSATESTPGQRTAPVVSMRDLLASCAAAKAVSTPPRLPDPETLKRPVGHPKAA